MLVCCRTGWAPGAEANDVASGAKAKDAKVKATQVVIATSAVRNAAISADILWASERCAVLAG